MQGTGDKIKGALQSGPDVEVELDWRDSIAHPDDRQGHVWSLRAANPRSKIAFLPVIKPYPA
jgi:hypothetical protein